MPEISKAYEPQTVEAKWYQFWLDRNCFAADAHSARPAYSIVIPPPNVTGVLTLGHVLNNTIQDILARKARMDGKEVLWLPGTDHAGIATENVVSRQLRKEEHKSKQEIGREEFLKRVWTWKEKHGGIILQQLKALGASCDWTRTRFTMDDHYKRCVTRVFVDLYRKGLIYRGKRMVNWCPATLTALSDEEVTMKEQKGSLYYFKVEVAESADLRSSRGHETPSERKGGEDPSLLTATAADKSAFGPVTDAEGRIWLTIATTRPETIPGDTAVAVNPKDARYAHLIGKHVIRPLPAELPHEQKLIPIVGDEHIDIEFGTGVLKVTPAHDKADFDIGQRHQLPVVDVMNPDGTMNDLAGADLRGLDRFKARKVAAEKLAELGAIEKEEPYTNNVGFSERADVPIEPRLSEQWFLKYPSAEPARTCVALDEGSARASRTAVGASAGSIEVATSSAGSDSHALPDAAGEAAATRAGRALPGTMHFYPERWAKVYDHWMANIQDWCISRQLWWGHRIPVWTWKAETNLGSIYASLLALVGQDVCDEDAALKSCVSISLDGTPVEIDSNRFHELAESNDPQLTKKAPHEVIVCTSHERVESNLNSFNEFAQDPDVLDTWFSSWLWPFATMGWPEQTDTLKKFYPTTDLVTGPDIIFFWVARMIMAGYEYMGEMPFQNVYFTGIIRDKLGRKMSKSLGNSPDPLDLIGKYGADALRFGIMRSAPQGQDLLFDEQSVELGRNFCNKLWNACRFRQMQSSAEAAGFEAEIRPELLSSYDKWILLKLDAAIREVTDALNGYRFNEAAQALYRFFWTEYCDWYVEASKAVLAVADSGRGNETPSGQGDPSPSTVAAARRENTLAVIDFVLSNTLRLFHPFLPFITEELWQGMGFNNDLPQDQGGDTIMFAHWPKPFDQDFKDHYGLDESYREQVENRFELVRQGRNLRSGSRIAANQKVRFVLRPQNEVSANDIAVIATLLNAETLKVNPTFDPGKGTARAITPLGELFLPLAGLIDLAAEKARLEKEVAKARAEIEKVQQKLSNPNFTQKVPPNVLAEHQQRLADWTAKRDQIEAALRALE